jgi:hypothetical protein
MTGTSTREPITAANASPELIPKTAMATAMANSKLLLAAVFAGQQPLIQPLIITKPQMAQVRGALPVN